jgi:hypothetical protein
MGIAMKFLIIGLGSMGKRRIRNLQTMGYKQIAGFDLRQDRIDEAHSEYDVKVYKNFNEAIEHFEPDVFIISTSPKYHMDYAIWGEQKNIPCFIEASVIDRLKIKSLSESSKKSRTIIAPSCTMRYFPGPKTVKDLLSRGVIGKPLSFNYITGQYLPDWHPWEKITDFYVSERSTGGAREIVPFELTWLNDIFGKPTPLTCYKGKVSDIDADIDDIYHCVLNYPGSMLANITIEVVSRPKATRELRIMGSEGLLVMTSDEQCVKYCSVKSPEWTRITLKPGSVEKNYINPEEPYIAELSDFILAIKENNQKLYPNTLDDDCDVLEILEKLESLSEVIS